MSYKIFCMGNPLLDMQVRDGEAILKKYDLKANDAILAEDKHQPMCVTPVVFCRTMITDDVCRSYEEIVKDYTITYVAGGAGQNAARGAAVSILATGHAVDLTMPFS